MTTPLSGRIFVAPLKFLETEPSFYSDSALESSSFHDPPPYFSDSNSGAVRGRSRQTRYQRAVILDFAEGDERGNDMAPSDEDLGASSDKRFKQKNVDPSYISAAYLGEIVVDSEEKGDWVQHGATSELNNATSKSGLHTKYIGEVKTSRRRWQVEGHSHCTSSFLHKTRNRLESQASPNEDRDLGQPVVRVVPECRRDTSRGRNGVPSITVHCSPVSPGNSAHRVHYHPANNNLHRSRSEVPEKHVLTVVERSFTSESSSSSKTPKAPAAARSTRSHLSDTTSTNHSNSTSSNSWVSGLASRHKGIPRRQWSKPNPELLLQFNGHSDSSVDELKENIMSRTARTSCSQLTVAQNGSCATANLSQLSRHPSLAELLSSGSAINKLSRKEDVMAWLKTAHNPAISSSGSKSSRCPTSEETASSWEEKSDDVWLSCRDGYDSAVDGGYDEIFDNGHNEETPSQKELTLEIVPDPDCKGSMKIHVPPCKVNSSSAPIVKSGIVPGVGQFKKSSTFTNMEERFNKQCQSKEKMRKTRSSKQAWAKEALENALNSLHAATSKEKGALIQSIGKLASFYPEVAEAEQLAVVRGLAGEIRDCRPRVVRLAVICLQWLFSQLSFNMVQGLTETYDVLLDALISTKCRLLKQDLWAVLDHLVDIVVPQQAIQILVHLFHKYEEPQARVAISRFLRNAIEKQGSSVVLLAGVKLADLVVQAAALFAISSDPLIRANGLSIIRLLETHPGFLVAYKVHLSEETVRLVTPLLRIRNLSS